MNPIKMTSKVLPAEHVTAMCKAMRVVPAFTVTRTRDTVIATHATRGEIYRALRDRNGLWLIRHAADLFE